jgi:DNA-binding beta-propeller fold protein YncE
MSDEPQGSGWWQASDLKWYPPERHPNYEAPPPPGRPPVPQPRPAEWPPTEIGTSPPPSEQGPRRQLKWPLIVVTVAVIAAGITGYLYINAHRVPALPFTGLNRPWGVAVDTAGDVYVTDEVNNRVLKLAAGSSNQTVLPFTGLFDPHGVAVDTAGNVYVADYGISRVLKLAAGSSTQTVLRSPASTIPWVWRWTPRVTCTSSTTWATRW